MKKTKKTLSRLKEPKRTGDMPVTRKLLDLTEKRLTKEMTSGRLFIEAKLTSEVSSIRSDISSLRSDVSTVQSDIASIRSDISSTQSDIASIRSDISSTQSDIASIRSDISSTQSETSSLRSSMQSEISTLRSSMQSEISAVRSDMKTMETRMMSQMEKMAASIFHIEALVEEQNIRNAAALDGYTSLYDHQIHTNKRLNAIETVVFGKEQK